MKKEDLTAFAMQCPSCCTILEMPCFNDGCKECGLKEGFEILYKLKGDELWMKPSNKTGSESRGEK